MPKSRDFDYRDILNNRKFQVTAISVAVLAVGAVVYFSFFNNPYGTTDASNLPAAGTTASTLPGNQRPGGGPGGTLGKGPGGTKPAGPGQTVAVPPVAPVSGVTSGVPIGGPAKAGAKLAAVTPAAPPPDSFVGEPAGYGTGAAVVGTDAIKAMVQGGGVPAMPTTPATPTVAAGAKPDPIKPNVRAVAARLDPFVPFYKFIIEEPPAFSLISPIRLAARPTPTPVPPESDPNIRFGPLPAVERRVAGVLFDGSVSAILETGAPGAASTDIQVVQPGSTVPSGAPNVEPLTVASISPREIVLRAQDGRTTIVKLSNVSAEYSDAFHNATSGPGIGQNAGGGAPGMPGGGAGRTGGGQGTAAPPTIGN